MLAAQRKATILREVSSQGAIRIADLAETLGVTEVTIRRDIDQLLEQGLVDKVHGGVTALGFSSTTEPTFDKTSQLHTQSKTEIARAAATLVQPGHAVALMGGSTVYALAQELVDIPRLTVVTNSVPVSDFYAREPRPGWTIVLTGGERTPTDSLVGALAVQAFREFNVDLAFMGSHGMAPDGGFSSPNMLEAEINREVIKNASETIILADHTKWGLRGFSSFGDLSAADAVVVDEATPQDAIDTLRNHVATVIVAPASKTAPQREH
jgi:DeoR/GlpR family transcriptional regulator of sugar metabolism